MRIIVIILACSFWVAPSAAQENHFRNPSIKGPSAWAQSSRVAGVVFNLDSKVGKSKKGSLRINNESGSLETPFNWRQVCRVDKAKTRRFRLAAYVKTQGLKAGTKVNLIAQCWDADDKTIHFVQCAPQSQDGDWRIIEVVFELPPKVKSLFVMAYIVGRGEVWWDDFVLSETTKPLTPAAKPNASRSLDDEAQKLARGVGSDIPWQFDAAQAKSVRSERRNRSWCTCAAQMTKRE
ncbi:MAG: hypothetical protein V3W41_15580 [Planctomycetota bacterium]